MFWAFCTCFTQEEITRHFETLQLVVTVLHGKKKRKNLFVQTDAIPALIPSIQYLTQNVDCTFDPPPTMSHHEASAVQSGPLWLSQSV